MSANVTAGNADAEWRRFWFLPFVAALGYSTSVLHIYSMGPFFGPLADEFGWSRAETASGMSITSIVGALACVPFGMLVDRLGPRRVGLIGVLLMCAGVAILATATGTLSNWLLLWGALSIGTFGVQAMVWTSAVASRFENARGLAFAITLSGASVAATAFPPLVTWLIANYGWRAGFAGLGAIWFVVVFPLLLLLFRGARDERKPAAAQTAAQIAHGLTLSEALRAPPLYVLLLAGALFSFTTIAVMVHFVPILTDAGADPLAAAGVAALIGIFSIIGRIGTGVLLDRFPGHLVGAAVFLIPVVGASLLLLDGSDPLYQGVAAAAFGLTVGSEVDVIAYLAAKHFGLRNYGALHGALVMALGLGTAFGPLAAGMVYDANGSYAPFLMLTIALTIVASLALILLGPPKLRPAGA